MLDPLKRIMEKYKPLFTIMQADHNLRIMEKYKPLFTIIQADHNLRIMEKYKPLFTIMQADHNSRIMEKYKPLFTIMQADHNSIEMAKVSETPHVQIVFYDSQFFETCQLIKLKSISFQKLKIKLNSKVQFLIFDSLIYSFIQITILLFNS